MSRWQKPIALICDKYGKFKSPKVIVSLRTKMKKYLKKTNQLKYQNPLV